jgi:hypothetical protein
MNGDDKEAIDLGNENGISSGGVSAVRNDFLHGAQRRPDVRVHPLRRQHAQHGRQDVTVHRNVRYLQSTNAIN